MCKPKNQILKIKFIVMLLLLLNSKSFAQAVLRFKYDQAGNQVVRQVFLNSGNKTVKPVAFEKFNEKDKFSYYPNPVTETLYLKWNTVNDLKMQEVLVSSMNGIAVKKVNRFDQDNTAEIPFQDLPQGIYLVNLIFTNGDREEFKVIKK
jgi:hypothetical protein